MSNVAGMTSTSSLPIAAAMQSAASSASPPSREKVQALEVVVSKFVSLLGTKSKSSANGNEQEITPSSSTSSNSVKQKELLSCFSSTVSDNDVVCSLPSLDMKLSEDADNNPLPQVGEHMQISTSGNNLVEQASGKKHPIMEVSVLNNAADASASAARLEQKAAQRLCTLTSWTKSSMVYASDAISKNVCNSFSSLVDSRVRAWTLLMFRHSLSSGDAASRTRLLSMLSASIKIKSAESSFRTLPMPESASGKAKEADVILPLLFEVVLTISLQDRPDSVTLRAPGTVAGNFASDNRLINVEVRLDSGALLSSMVDQARLSVFKTVAKVTATDIKGGAVAESPSKQAEAKSPAVSASSLSQFSSSLKLSAAAVSNSPRLEKARSSALRLNSVLHSQTSNKDSTVAGLRKQRSVQWDKPLDIPSLRDNMAGPAAKRQRVSQSSAALSTAPAARLKSFKSFGRPHAEDEGTGPRNATFGDFGRKPLWGRDGRLVNHPSPVNSLERSQQDLMGVRIAGSANATFSSSSALSLRALTTSKKPANNNSNNSNRPRSNLPRTATALESWLMNATSGK